MRINRLRPLAVAGLALLALSAPASAQSRVGTNVVYGMYSGTALLLDVHYPAQPNGFGIIFLGELLITSASRRLTLLRVKLGASPVRIAKRASASGASDPFTGEIVCADVESNGGVIF